MNDVAAMNDTWAFHMIDQLIRSGACHFFIAPGSRSSALTLAAAKHKQAQTVVHFDERSLAFQALGFAKGSNTPAVMILTSGTAVGNILPAIMEAHHSYVPLIILSADRPPELRDCGANQTIDQVKIFQQWTRWNLDLPCADMKLLDTYLPSVISYAAYICKQTPKGPVHINCMFREPLHSLNPYFDSPPPLKAPHYNVSKMILSDTSLHHIAESLCKAQKGVILAGSLPNIQTAHAVARLSDIMQWPLISDITSQIRSTNKSRFLIKYFDTIIKTLGNVDIDCVLHLGDRFISKTIASWLKNASIDYINITEHQDRFDPLELRGERYSCDISWFVDQIEIKELTLSNKLHFLPQLSFQVEHVIEKVIQKNQMQSELALSFLLPRIIPSEWSLFFGNSMPARDADSYFYSHTFSGKIFLNRGVSGIDGNISTTLGLARALQSPIVAVLGDLTFLHDMSALTQIVQSPFPIILIVINNFGGGIFSFLPISHHKDVFEEYFATSHNLSLEPLAKFAGIDFISSASIEHLSSLFDQLKNEHRHCIIEIKTCRDQNVNIRQELQHILKDQLCLQPHLLEI
jgi:2-succinyl-5-enolpyruvyl-6-hydroxy-3-cyclohexene-1-carboxylate synthase